MTTKTITSEEYASMYAEARAAEQARVERWQHEHPNPDETWASRRSDEAELALEAECAQAGGPYAYTRTCRWCKETTIPTRHGDRHCCAACGLAHPGPGIIWSVRVDPADGRPALFARIGDWAMRWTAQGSPDPASMLHVPEWPARGWSKIDAVVVRRARPDLCINCRLAPKTTRAIPQGCSSGMADQCDVCMAPLWARIDSALDA